MQIESLKYTIGMLFIPNILFLVPVLIRLSISKKRFIDYEEQIAISGKIEERKHYIKFLFDPFLFIYIFSEIPTENIKPNLYKFEEIKELKNRIQLLTKFAKSLSTFILVLAILALMFYGFLSNK